MSQQCSVTASEIFSPRTSRAGIDRGHHCTRRISDRVRQLLATLQMETTNTGTSRDVIRRPMGTGVSDNLLHITAREATIPLGDFGLFLPNWLFEQGLWRACCPQMAECSNGRQIPGTEFCRCLCRKLEPNQWTYMASNLLANSRQVSIGQHKYINIMSSICLLQC
jgi:hypothetical protein